MANHDQTMSYQKCEGGSRLLIGGHDPVPGIDNANATMTKFLFSGFMFEVMLGPGF